ncbi:alcohol dehydrogenase [Bifidobacterium asteroides]|uniref:alcohol dehydrogenase n=1 Tax=Bifidobacterium asteroides TaxID=1684 RepID=UPI0015E888CE|nr:alcohol dehydrogenase [Bifidobacterium asteroides]
MAEESGQTSPFRCLLGLPIGLAVGVLGTLVQRSGAAQGLPWGMALAYLLVALAAWWVRSDSGTMGLALHLVASTVVVWLLSMRGPGGDVLMPYANFPTFFAKYAVFLWMGGLVLIQTLAICLPASWFADGPLRRQERSA